MHRLFAGLIALSLSSAALAGDPFDDARWYIGAKQSSEALKIVDSGQLEVNAQTAEGYTLLHYAAEAGDLATVKALLERGADPRIESNSGFSVYEMAIGTLVQAEIRKAVAAWNGGGAPQATAAGEPVAAAPAGSNGMCEQARSDPASASRSPAMRPFLAAKDAIWYNHPDQLAGLLEDCVSVGEADEYGWTLLHHAADRDRIELARILLAHGAASGPRNRDGQTAAHLATSAEMKALIGSDATAAAPANAADARRLECRQKYEADAALASDSTGRMSAMRRWQQCLDTGRYW
jgi:ankyrin repeat protein